MHHTTKIVHEYRGCNILVMNRGNASVHYGIQIGEDISAIALSSVKACKNVIDTYIRASKRMEDYKL